MNRRIKISESQLHKVLGINEAFHCYFNNYDNGVAGTQETNADGVCLDANGKTDITSSEPVTADKIADKLVQRNPMTGPCKKSYDAPIAMAESKKKLQEDNSNLKDNRYHIPDDIYSNLQQICNTMGDKAPKRLLSLINSKDKGLSYKEMYRLKGVFDGTDKKFGGDINAIGGDNMRNWVNQQLEMSKCNDQQRRNFDQNVFGKKKIDRINNKGKGHDKKSNPLEPKITYFE